MIVNAIFCVWISHQQNALNLLLFFADFSLFILTKFVYEGYSGTRFLYKQLLLRLQNGQKLSNC